MNFFAKKEDFFKILPKSGNIMYDYQKKRKFIVIKNMVDYLSFFKKKNMSRPTMAGLAFKPRSTMGEEDLAQGGLI